MTHLLIEVFIYLFAAMIAVPVSKQLGLGSVLGYLLAGIIIGPLLGLVGDETKDIQHIAEFGVVMMLFLVGLELEPEKLWQLRHKLLGLGGLQVGLTIAVFTAGGMALGLSWSVSLAIGCVLSLSSTAIVLQTLGEKGLLRSQGGQASFSVLLFQDIAVIPMLALLPLLALPELAGQSVASSHGYSLVEGLNGYAKGAVTLGAIAAIIVGGHYLTRPVIRFIARARLREVFTIFALALVIGIAALMSVIGLSPALGTFLAGVVLANSEYRHELESNIEPFKGLLLGLFFMTVGAGVDFNLLFSDFYIIIGITFGVILLKMAVLGVLGKLFRLQGMHQWLFALALAQAGEFGFVLLSFTVQSAVIPTPLADQLLLVVALSMVLTPLLFIIHDKLVMSRAVDEQQQDNSSIDEHNSVIIAGHGRFGQMVNRLLLSSGYTPTVIDLDAVAVEGMAKVGYKSYFGDATRPELLESAGIKDAKLLVVAVDDKEQALRIVSHAHLLRPELPILARAYDRLHTYDLYQAGASVIIRETFDAAIRCGRSALELLGIEQTKAKQLSELFYHRDRHSVVKMASVYDPELPRFANDEMAKVGREVEDETAQLMQALLRGETVDWQAGNENDKKQPSGTT